MAKTRTTPAQRVAARQRANVIGDAAERGDLPQMRRLLKEDPSLAHHWKPLFYGALAGQPAAVKLLLGKGADPNMLGPSQCPTYPLHRVVEHKRSTPKHAGHEEVVRLLLDAGADVTRRTAFDGTTPIDVAARTGEVRFLPLLLAKLKEWDVYLACVLGDERRVTQFLEKDLAAVTKPDSRGWTPLHHCAASRVGRNDAAAAARLGTVARLLIARGADVNAKDNSEWKRTPLYLSAGNPAVMRLLIDAGADPTPALFRAIHDSEFEAAEALLAAGADIRDERITNMMPGCAQFGHANIVQWAVTHGADPNARDRWGKTATHWACSRGFTPAFLQMLADHGADVHARDPGGVTPLMIAQYKKRAKQVEWFDRYAGRHAM